ncbi:hypothetical protein [uncultured Tateyamaria sp.]|uniref:hypothetical protein n=1 Tax=uncultured Tateyamaria sp. TaxID=455651 RepID=UPI00261B34A9|nr:hypothetical protein [uncultured Tateyamaria sp.]
MTLVAHQKLPTDKVTIRMYRMGFGDCFLLSIPHEDGARRVLIDCGSIKKDPKLNKSTSEISKQVIKDIRDDEGKARIDILIASHRHKDHVAGFSDPVWDDVEVGEVWLPWTESDADPDALALRSLQDSVATRLNAILGARGKLGLAELAANALSNAEAMERLKTGFKTRDRRKPRYIGAEDTDPQAMTTPHLPGVVVHVLGPPRDVAVISRDLPHDDEELFLRLGVGNETGSEAERNLLQPFGREWVDDVAQILDPNHIDLLEKAISMDAENLLSAIEDSLNNTSIVLVFEIAGRFLLFPGDAQWGPWQQIMANDEATKLLRKVSFYKVSHHASHNGTPQKFVLDLVGKDTTDPLVAYVPVTPHGGYRDIPRPPLMEALSHRFDRLAISEIDKEQTGFVRQSKWSIDFEVEVDHTI